MNRDEWYTILFVASLMISFGHIAWQVWYSRQVEKALMSSGANAAEALMQRCADECGEKRLPKGPSPGWSDK